MIVRYERAAELPEEWDSAVHDNVYLTREFLAFMETADSEKKTYYGVYDRSGKLDTVFETIERKGYNLAMFTRFNFRIKVTMVYVPLSVTRPGIEYGECLTEAAEFIRKLPGYKIFLNLPNIELNGYAKGLTCPKCVLSVRWKTFDGYMDALRSNYRYRFRKALKKAAPLKIRYLESGDEFTDELYGLYEQVYNKSRIRVEKLTKEFFRGDFFKIFVLEEEGVPRGFVQLLANGDELVFEFVGLDYSTQSKYDTYLAMLLEIVRYAIDSGFKTVDFGQTADDTKLKLGSDYIYLYAFLSHRNRLINAVCKKLAPRLEYRPVTEKFDVFKQEKDKEVTPQ